MKRLQATIQAAMAKTKPASLGPDALATIVAVCKVASTIGVPGVQIACTAITEFITMMDTANANDRNWKALLSVIDSCAKRVTEFAESISAGQSSEYIFNSTDKKATIAREAIVEFEKAISYSKEKIEARLKNGKIRKRLGASAVQGEILECRQALTDALKDLDGRILNILCLPSTETAVVSKVKSDEFDIPGARAVLNQDIEILDDIDFVARIPETFWKSLVQVDHENKVRVTKMYRPANHSKQKFLEDIKWLSEKIEFGSLFTYLFPHADKWLQSCPKIARIYGYNANSQTPFIVFTYSSVKPLRDHLMQLSRKDPQNLILAGWRLFQDMHVRSSPSVPSRRLISIPWKKAGTYLCSVAEDLPKEYPAIERTLVDAATGQSGQLVVAPAQMRTLSKWDNPKDPSANAILKFWSHYLIDKLEERRERYLRPFILALLQSPEAFFQYPIRDLTSPLEASEAIRKLWPNATMRPFMVWKDSFPPDVMAGDVGILKVNLKKQRLRRPEDIEFRRLANIADLAGGIEFFSPPEADPTNSPNIFRVTFKSTEDTYLPVLNMGFYWGYRVGKEKIPLPVLAKLFKTLGEQHGVPPTDIVLVSNLDYELKAEDPKTMRGALQKGEKIYLYLSFSPENRLEWTKWSFHESPPTESEAAAEASKLSAVHCTKIFRDQACRGVDYLQFEEEDFDFYLNNSGNEGGMDQVATIEELSE